MSEQGDSSNANEVPTSTERLIGRVKWFNNRAGYGFITVTESGADKSGKDVFAHHSTITVADEQYKYLVLGEYVSFTWCVSDSDTHEFQAGDIRGVDGGFLMCETRNEQTKNRQDDDHDDRAYDRRDVPSGGGRPFFARNGRGPRGGDDEWMVVRRGSGGNGNYNNQDRGGDRGGSRGGDRGGSRGGDRGGSRGGDRGGSRGGDDERPVQNNRYDMPEF